MYVLRGFPEGKELVKKNGAKDAVMIMPILEEKREEVEGILRHAVLERCQLTQPHVEGALEEC